MEKVVIDFTLSVCISIHINGIDHVHSVTVLIFIEATTNLVQMPPITGKCLSDFMKFLIDLMFCPCDGNVKVFYYRYFIFVMIILLDRFVDVNLDFCQNFLLYYGHISEILTWLCVWVALVLIVCMIISPKSCKSYRNSPHKLPMKEVVPYIYFYGSISIHTIFTSCSQM